MQYLYQSPIQMPRGTQYGSDYWICQSFKLKRRVHLYSLLEYANFITLEMSPTVEFFCEQPLKITSFDSKEKQTSVFDFWVYYSGGTSEFQEVKYTSELTGSDETSLRSQKQIEFQRTWCNKNGCKYRVVTEVDLLNNQFTIQNLELLHKHLLRNDTIPLSQSDKLLKSLSKNSLSIELIKSMNLLPKGSEFCILAQLVYLGKVTLNINDRPIDNATEVTLCELKSTTF